MALALRLAWRGLVRAQLKLGVRVLQSLINYNAKHGATMPLFTAPQLGTVTAAQTILSNAIALKIPR